MANSVTARFNDDCKVFVSMSDDTTVEKAVIIDAEGNETDIGGGGGGDFSTAEVSVEINTEDVIEGMFVDFRDSPISAVVPKNTLSNMSRIYNVPLYKGVCSWTFMGGTTISVSGDIEWDSAHRIALIKGDGTITVS